MSCQETALPGATLRRDGAGIPNFRKILDFCRLMAPRRCFIVAGVTNGAEAQLLIDQANLLAQYIPSGDTLLIGDNTQVLLAGLLPSQLSVKDFIFA